MWAFIRKSKNSATLGELDDYPLVLEITADTVLHFKHLVSEMPNVLLKEAVLCNSTY